MWVGLGGGVWGLGVIRALAYGLHWSPAFRVEGALFGALMGFVGGIFIGRTRLQRGWRPTRLVVWSLPLFLPLVSLISGAHNPWRGPVLLAGSALLLLLTVRLLPRGLGSALAALVPLAVYVPEISPYVGRADTFEFQVVGPQLGVAHPSGYPLYTLICKLFSLLPVGSMAWRVNLSSAIFAALTAVFLYRALSVQPEGASAEPLARSSATGRVLALSVAWILAFSPTLWSRAVEAEVYALNAFLVAVGLWLAIRWHRGQLETAVAWPAFGLLIGLGVASHITLGALVFIAAAGLLVPRLRPPLRSWALACALGLLGLLLYAYIPLRWPAVTGGETMSLAQFVRFVTNAESGGALHPLAFYRDSSRWALVGRLLKMQVGWVALGLSAIGFLGLGREHPALALGTGLAFGAWVWFNLSFYVADPDYSAFLIPAHVILCFWLGWGARALLKHLTERCSITGRSSWSSSLLLTTVFLIALSRLWQTGPSLETRAQGRSDEAWARYVLELPLAPRAALLADSEKFPPLYYLQQIEGMRPDLEMVTLFSEAQYREAMETRLAAGRRVYLARYLPGVDVYGVSSVGPLVEVAPPTLVAEMAMEAEHATGVSFGEGLTLIETDLAPDAFGRPMHHLTLVWQVSEPVSEDLEVRFRLTDPATEEALWELNGGRPVSGYTTTESWEVGWQVQDYHAIEWPVWLPAGTYTLDVALFPRFQDEGWAVAGSSDPWHRFGRLAVDARPHDALPNRHTVLLASRLWVVGTRLPGEVTADTETTIDLAWACEPSHDPKSPLQIIWRSAEGAKGNAVTHVPLHSLGEREDAGPCGPSASSAVRRYVLPVPSEPGRYRLEIGGASLSEPSARCYWLGRGQATCPLGTVTVTPVQIGLADFDQRILLVESTFDAEAVPAGGPLHVDLTWRATQSIGQNYTVFVQVIGPDGQLYGQVDSWPVQGARPTSEWRLGEQIRDPYTLYVDTDGPPGDYRVITGWYLLADMTRLPVVDSDGREIGDSYEIGSFELP
ncbi:MAG: glycosyltransferase family 117 protein [Anaerolineae bacterium]